MFLLKAEITSLLWEKVYVIPVRSFGCNVAATYWGESSIRIEWMKDPMNHSLYIAIDAQFNDWSQSKEMLSRTF